MFTVMGDGNKMWLGDLHELGVRLVQARHEGAALAMADGYSRATGRVGVASVTYGPGVSQLSTSMLVATKHRSEVVVFAADVERSVIDGGGQLDVNERALLETAGAKVWEVTTPALAAETVRMAFLDARSASRPVAVLAAVDLQELPGPPSRYSDPTPAAHATAQATGRSASPRSAPSRPVPADSELREALRVLRETPRPLILAGAGALRSGALPTLVELSERLGAALATSFNAKGAFDGHPRNLGLAGGFAFDTAKQVMAKTGVVLAVGASLNDHTSDHGRLVPDAIIVQVDTLGAPPPGASLAADIYLCGDAAATTARLVELLDEAVDNEPAAPAPADALTKPPGSPPRRPPEPPGRQVPGWPAEELPEVGRDPRMAQIGARPAAIGDGRLDPRALMIALDRVLPDDCLVVVGGGHFMGFAAQYLTNPGRRRFEMVFDFMTTGQAVPTAIGAAAGCADRMVVAIEGDASFLMHCQEIETAARSAIAPLIVIVNDGALGAEYHKLTLLGRDPSPAIAEPPDLAALGEALGGTGRRVTSLEHLGDLTEWYDRRRGPHVVDCLVSRDVLGAL